MKILNVAQCDYAQYSHNFSKALQSIGFDSIDWVQSKHPFNYKSESKVVSISEMVKGMIDADVVIVHHSHPMLFELAKNNCKGKVIVTHTGTRYREGHNELDILFKDTLCLTDQTEFFDFNKKLKYVVSPVEFETSHLFTGGKLKVAHYPSNADVKGTAKIIEMIKPFVNDIIWNVSVKQVDHYLQLERMARCDVYIELFKPELNGKPYGCFGVTALEAAAMGKIVITNNLFPKIYTEAYGHCPVTIANTEWSFKNIISGLIDMSTDMIRMVQKESAEIMIDNHSFKATGKRILKLINE